jgi:hypothetical protein
MENEIKNCKKCKKNFELDQDDFSFYEKIKVPVPEICPTCRNQQRMFFRNFKTLYKRKSNKSGEMIITMYNPDVLFPVWDISEWWSDDWGAIDYGIKLDLSRRFTDQMKELSDKVPRFSIMNTKSENCEYSNMALRSKNCYLVFGCVESENCDYGHIVWYSKDSIDNLYLNKSEFCYECVDCLDSNKLLYSHECESCVDSIGLYDCRGCVNCIGCVGLRQQTHQIFNKQVSKEEYQEFLKRYPLNEESSIIYILNKMEELRKKMTTRALFGSHNENVSGDHIYNSHNIGYSFDVKKGENSRYCYTSVNLSESYDISFNPNISYGYQTLASTGSANLIGTHLVHDSNYVYYSDSCNNSNYLFGCFGLRNKKYCILNKQYTKEEFEELFPKIIENMEQYGDWGNFFPISMCPFAYNESIANEYMPLTKDEALKQGFTWRDDIPRTTGQENCKHEDLPKDSNEYSDDKLLGKILKCESCGFNYKFISREITFYKRMKLAIPSKCFNCRHQSRMERRNPRILNETNCFTCRDKVMTTYPKDKHNLYKIYCEKCYKKEIN